MKVTREAKLHDLLQAYPYLVDFLAELKPEFTKLNNPVLRNTVARVATLNAVAEMGGMPVDELIDAIESEIARHEIHARPASSSMGAADDESRTKRQALLKEIIRELHAGASVDDVKARFDALVSEVDAAEIAAMEQALIAEGMPVTEVQRLCDVHVAVFKESLEGTPDAELAEHHPVTSYRRENLVAGEVVASLRCSLEEAETLAAEDAESVLDALASGLERLLAGLTTHYRRKENQLFPLLERHGIEGPTKVMWGIDDDIRGRLKTALQAARSGDAAAVASSLPETLGMVEDMIYKEEKILFPTALEALSDGEWESMAAGESEIGFAWIEPPPAGAATAPATVPERSHRHPSAVLLPLTTGALSIPQLDLMVRCLPFDITFVDEYDRVQFYSAGDRVFPRSTAVIGREAKNCHPPKSVDVVERILAAFKAGEKDVAEFWIELSGRFIHIRYYALRDEDEAYRGCLEIVQDATHVRGLTGERRLLDWE